jgi:hypothetical protein
MLRFAVRSEVKDTMVIGQRFVLPTRSSIVRLAQDGEPSWELPSPMAGPNIIMDRASGYLFEACSGLGVIDPVQGRRRHLVVLEGAELLSIPAVDGDRVYLTNVDGEIVVLESPVRR